MIKGGYGKSLSIKSELEDEILRTARILMLNIDRRLVMETPVDTGAAKRNWIASTRKSVNKAIDLGDDENVSTQAMIAIEQGAAAIKGARVYDDIYITNNLPYIESLNEGSSLQAPTNFVDAIIEQEVLRSK